MDSPRIATAPAHSWAASPMVSIFAFVSTRSAGLRLGTARWHFARLACFVLLSSLRRMGGGSRCDQTTQRM